jgi:hypothetical protein
MYGVRRGSMRLLVRIAMLSAKLTLALLFWAMTKMLEA